jgi:hypothetical protein
MKFNDLDMDRNVLNILVSYRIVPLDVISSIEINTAAN